MKITKQSVVDTNISIYITEAELIELVTKSFDKDIKGCVLQVIESGSGVPCEDGLVLKFFQKISSGSVS